MAREFVNFVVEDGIALVTVDRPPMNAMNTQLKEEIWDAFDELERLSDEKKIGVVIVTGGGTKAFMAGADIVEMSAQPPDAGAERARATHRAFGKVARFPRPVIAAIRGFALGGGCELAMACDIRIAAESARLGLPEINLAIFPGGGGTQRLPRLIGPGKAKQLIFTGEFLKAEEALRLGLIEQVVPDDQLLDAAKEMARKILSKGPIAVRLAKRAINEGLEVSLEKGLEIEARYFAEVFASEDRVEGTKAFVEKRPPSFRER